MRMSGQKLMSGKAQAIGHGYIVPAPIQLDPADYEGAFIYASDQNCYYSDGVTWRIPSTAVPVARPTALAPTNSLQQTQLRLTNFFSPTGLTQTGIYFEVAATVDGFDNPLFTKSINSTTDSMYQTIFPDDGLVPGQEFYWRAFYTATEGQQSDWSFTFKQTYPNLIDTPDNVTRDGATAGSVELTPYNSAFGLIYGETQIQFWETTQNPDIESPVETVNGIVGASISIPVTLNEGQGYYWRGRYSGTVGIIGAPTYSDWSPVRTVLNGVRTMILVYDPALAVSRTINLPLGVYGGLVNVTVNWGDGTSEVFTTPGIKSKTYAAEVSGYVTVTISGQLEQYGGNTNITGLIRVNSYGMGLGLTSIQEMFRNCTSNTVYVDSAIPPTVKNCSSLFSNSNPGFEVGNLDMSNVTNMSGMFSGASFNQPLNNWNVSNVTNMSNMFANTSFNQPIGNWNVSNVTNMSGMFFRNSAFNQPLNNWNVSNVTNMSGMFNTASAFNQPIGNWNVSNVTNMSIMFNIASAFNQPIGNWNVSNVTNMSGMFNIASAFNQPIGNWNVSNVTNMSIMFANTSFNQPLNNWDLSSTITVVDMFNLSSFNNDVTGWILPENLNNLFRRARVFNHSSIVSWNTSNVKNMSGMFEGAWAFNQPIGNWDVSNVTDMSSMFLGQSSNTVFNQPLNNWNVSNVENMSNMFRSTGTGGYVSINAFNQPLNNWNVSKVSNMSGMFSSEAATTTNRGSQFNQDISMWTLRSAGVTLDNFLQNHLNISTENYSKLLASWANTIRSLNGPFGVIAGFGNRTYNSVVYFPGSLYQTAVAARAYLTNSNRLQVDGATIGNGNGTYTFNTGTQLYVNTNNWYFVKIGDLWLLRDNSNVTQATQTSLTIVTSPQLVTTWDNVLATATVTRTGAAWTITDGGLV